MNLSVHLGIVLYTDSDQHPEKDLASGKHLLCERYVPSQVFLNSNWPTSLSILAKVTQVVKL